jgi:mRNA-degrading endonuclease toxin of MazEF toxin-antitoxin module
VHAGDLVRHRQRGVVCGQNGAPKDSVANVSQIVVVDRGMLSQRVGHVSEADLALVLAGIDLVLGRE